MSQSDRLLVLQATVTINKKVNFDSFIIVSDNVRTKKDKETLAGLLGKELVELTEDLIISEN